MLITKKKKVIVLLAVIAAALAVIVFYQIYVHLEANKQRASKASQGQVAIVEIAQVSKHDLAPVMIYSANLEPIWTADISPKVDGRLESVFVNEGDRVQAGGIVALLDTNELAALVVQAEGSLLQAQSNLEQAESDLARLESLVAKQAISIQTYETARTKRDAANGQLRSAAGNLNWLQHRLESAKIQTPQEGVVTRRYLQSGAYAKTGTAIIAIANVDSLLAKATVSEAEVNLLQVGATVKVRVAALGNQEFEGIITRISPVAAMPSRTFIAEVTIDNRENQIKAGMFAKMEIPGQIRQQVLAVPETALVMREDQKTVYVVTTGSRVQQRLVKLGYVGGGWAEVLEGLQEGEKIVVAGHNKLKDGSQVREGGTGI